MKVQMKRCVECRTLLNKALNLCTKCGSRELKEWFYESEPKESGKNIWTYVQFNKPSRQISCPTCSVPVTINNGYGECCFCGEEISNADSLLYFDYRDLDEF